MSRRNVDLEELLGIDPERLNPQVRRRLTQYVASREEDIAKLRKRAIDAESETKALQNRIAELNEELEALRDRVDRPQEGGLDPSTVVSAFGDALESERLAEAGFTISDLRVDLRTNVIQTDQGIQLQLPDPGATKRPESLSDVQFSLRSDVRKADPDFVEVPDLTGLDQQTAKKRLEEANLQVGAVEQKQAARKRGTVIDQLPSAFALTENNAEVDLTVAAGKAEEMIELVGRPLTEAIDRLGDQFRLQEITVATSDRPAGTVIDQQPPAGQSISEAQDITLTIAAPQKGDTNGDDDEPPGKRPVSNIDRIDERTAQQLAQRDIATIEDLASTDPREITEFANVRPEQARRWVKIARERLDEQEE